MKTIRYPKKLPRKIKKEVIKLFGNKAYKKVIEGKVFIEPKILTDFRLDPPRNIFCGWTLWMIK